MDVKSAQLALDRILEVSGEVRGLMDKAPLRVQISLSASAMKLLEAAHLLEYALDGEVKCAEPNPADSPL